MRAFTDLNGQIVFLVDETARHIADFHPEVSLNDIEATLSDPSELRMSSYQPSTVLYYRRRASKRYFCVVVKQCSDGAFVSTAMTTTKPKIGKVIYVSEK